MKNQFLSVLIALFVLPTLTAIAQVELSYQLRKSIVGAVDAEVLDDGSIVVSDDSKLSESIVAIVTASSSKPYKFSAWKSLDEEVKLFPLADKGGAKRFKISANGIVKFSAVSRTDDLDRSLQIIIGTQPKPEPTPKPDDPPTPTPLVTSFRVIFVKESGQTLNAEQTAITGSKAIRDYLSSKTTPEGGYAGWREYDPQQNVTNENTTMKALWAASKSSITKVPCMIIEQNGKAFVMAYPKNVAEAIKTLKEYGGD